MTTNALRQKTQNQLKWERSQHLVLLGCGKMGSALLEGWLHQKENFKRISIIEPAGISAELEALDLITCYVSLEQLIAQEHYTHRFCSFGCQTADDARCNSTFFKNY